MIQPQEIDGRYRIERRLGAGGMSTVFLAKDAVLERLVAVKLLAEHLVDDEAFVSRFRREALAAARLQHPNVVQVFDSGHDEPSQRQFIVMEFVDGPSCADLLRDRKRLEIDEAMGIIRDACQGLDYAHRAGVIHRDVKPGNLLVARDTGTAKLADFGIAKAAEQTRITQVGSVLGTAAYLSPEQARGDEAGPQSDIYSLGVCAYQLITGRLPYEYASLTELALKQQNTVAEPITDLRPEVPAALDVAIRLCLESHPDDRYASGLDMARALDAGLAGGQTEVTRQLLTGAALAGGGSATRVLEESEAATRTPRRTGDAPGPVPMPPSPYSSPTAARDPRRSGRAPTGRLLTALTALMVIVAIALLLLSDGGQSDIEPIRANDVQEQIDGIERFLREHTGR